MDALVPVVVGGLLALGGGLLGAWIQGRREHRRWIREQRFDAYQRALRLIEHIRGLGFDPVDDVIEEFIARDMADSHDAERDEMRERMRHRLGEDNRRDEKFRAMRALEVERVEVTTLLALVGPSDVAVHLSAAISEMADDDRYDAALERLVGAMWKPLGIMKPYRLTLSTTARQSRQPTLDV
ncbi:hypothetical protein [Microbacterium sp. bgisy207]|uniref:hypothetical protein n=1 Tax=Microbacterium sp. bgisy207 TaxID=3413800 RepID=UPI003EB78E2D